MPLGEASRDVPHAKQHGSFWLHDPFGYLFSPLLVGLGLAVLKLEFFFLPAFHFPGAPFFFIILLVAYVWGLGPALLTVALCGLALDFFYFPATFTFRFDIITAKSFAQMLPFVVVGSLISIITVQRETVHKRVAAAEYEQYKRASELEATFEAIADSVLIFDDEGNIRRSNKAARQLFSLAETFPLAERAAHFAVCDEQGTPLLFEQLPITRVLKGEVLTGTEAADVQALGAQGQKVQISVTGAPIYAVDGRLSGAVVVLRDVTTRRQLEKRTHHALGALLTMAETLVQRDTAHEESQVTSITATQETVTRLVKMAHKTLGCMHASITLVDDAGVLQPAVYIGFSAEQERNAQRIGQSLKESNAYASVIKRLQLNEVFVLDATIPPFNIWAEVGVSHPLLVPIALNEQLIGVLSLDYGDIDYDYDTDEIALAQATGRLIALVIERDRLERQRTEAHANEVSLREANRRMDDFLGIASHELRTPLTAMKGYIQVADIKLTRFMAQPPCVSDELVGAFEALQHLFQKADAQAELLNRLVNDLVDVSRIHTNKLRLNLAACDLVEVVSNAVQEQRQMAISHTISLQLPGNGVHVFADADRIGQVVTNYLTNALKYSATTAAVAVRLSVEGNAARVEVSDKGPGLASEQMVHLWERFYQVPGIMVQSGSSVGLGIGLYICETIVSSHGGAVGVHSTPGQGSTFWFTLPLYEEAG